MHDRLAALLLPLLGLLGLLALWQVGVVWLDISPAVLPPPLLVAHALDRNMGLLLAQGWITLEESLYGFVLAFVIGVPMAVVISSSQLLSRIFYPLLIATQSLPKVALAPIILVWLGTGMESKLAVAWLVAFFPIVVDTATGLRATPPELLDLAVSVRASGWQTFSKIRFPAALPFIISGSKVAVTLAVVGAVIGEFIGADEGLGNLLLAANSQMDTALAFAALIGLAVMGLVLYALVALVEIMLRPWLGVASH